MIEHYSKVLDPEKPCLILAPMDGFTDSPMRALQGELGAFDFAVSEFIRVSATEVPIKVFHREVPELLSGGKTKTGLPVQVQILGGHAGRMALSAENAVLAGASAVDINFGCPAPTVNRHDGGATILQYPARIKEIVSAVRESVPREIPVSGKVRLGWEDIHELADIGQAVQDGGAAWIVVHARTKMQKYNPPVYWKELGKLRNSIDIPVVANGDIWNIDDFRRCREETACRHFMLGRGALVSPGLPGEIRRELLGESPSSQALDWASLLLRLQTHMEEQTERRRSKTLHRLKQWLNLARRFGGFEGFEKLKVCQSTEEFFEHLGVLSAPVDSRP